MADIELARAFVEIIPVTKGISQKTKEEIFPDEKTSEKAADRAGKGFSNRLGSLLKKSAIGVGIAAGGVLATSLVKGFGRLSSIENAEAKLRGLGNSAEDVGSIMDNALASVRGTAFGMDEAATTAAAATAAGIKPGKELESYLRLVGDAATIAGTDMAGMGSIFNKVATSGKAQGDVFAQLGDAGIPIVSLLADTMGVTAEEVYKLGAAGKVGTDDFLAAMSSMEGAALEGGNTTTGAFKNMGAALSRFGAEALGGVYPLFGPFFSAVTGVIDQATSAIGPLIESITPGMQAAAGAALEWVTTLTDSVGGIGEVLASGNFDPSKWAEGVEEDSPLVALAFTVRDAWTAVSDLFGNIDWTAIGGFLTPLVDGFKDLGPALLDAWANLSPLSLVFQALAPSLPIIGEAIGKLVGSLGGALLDVLGALIPVVGTFVGVLSGVLATLLETLLPVFGMVVDAIAPLITQIGEMLAPILAKLGEVFAGLVAAVMPLVESLLGLLASVLEPLLDVFVAILEPVWALVGVLLEGVLWAVEKLTPVIGWLADVLAVVANVVAGALTVALQWVADQLPSAFAWVADTAVSLWNSVKGAWDGIKNAIGAVGTWVTGTLVPGIVGAWNLVAGAAMWLWQNVLVPAWNGIKVAIAVAAAIIMTYVDLLVWYWETILAPVAMWLYNTVIKPAWDGIMAAIGAVVNWFTGTAWPILKAAWDAVAAAAIWLWQNVLAPVWAGIRASIDAVVQWFMGTAWPFIQRTIAAIQTGFGILRDALAAAWAFIRDSVIAPVVSWFQNTAWPLISSVLESIKTGFNVMRDALQTAWTFIKDNVIQPVVSWFQNTVQPLFETTTSAIGDAFSTMKDIVKTAWEGIQEAAKAPIRFVVETVVNDALIKNFNKVAGKLGVKTLDEVSLPSGFWGGGILPGMSRMSDGDDQLVPLRRGEGVLVSEGLRTAADRAAFLAANAAGRRGIGFASLMQGGFAGGGIFGDAWRGAKGLAGDALDKVLEGVDFVAEAISDPMSMFTRVFDAVIGNIPAAGLVTDVAKASGKQLLDGVIGAVTGAFGGGDVGPPPPGGSRSLSYAQQVASSYGLTMTSFRRPGARTAGSGSLSLHAQGRAMDFSNSSGPTPQMMAFFNAMHGLQPTELLYSPAGHRQWRRSGRMADTSGATKRGHYNHVHVGFAGGGIYDDGGWLPPGGTAVNLSNRPEPVFNGWQWDLLGDVVESVGSGNTGATELSEEDRDLLRAIADAADLKVDGKSVVRTVKDSFRGARTPLVTS